MALAQSLSVQSLAESVEQKKILTVHPALALALALWLPQAIPSNPEATPPI